MVATEVKSTIHEMIDRIEDSEYLNDISELAVFQYRRMKEDLSSQLAELLSRYSLDVKISPSFVLAA